MPCRAVSLVCLIVTLAICAARAQAQKLTGPVTPTGVSPPAAGWKAVTVVDGLEHPWAMAFLPDGGMLITERPGRLRLVRDGRLVRAPLDGVPKVLAQRQGGLLDVALHPAFTENQFVYLSYSAGTNSDNRTTIARGRFTGTGIEDVKVLFQASPTKSGGLHFGSRMIFLPDHSLLFSVGDGFSSRAQAQDVASHLGKILRIGDDGAAAPGNPDFPGADARPEIWSYGHRNIQGLVHDPQSGRVWATEHGPLGGDELNLIEPGKNYGWPQATYGREYFGPRISEHTSLPAMVDPRAVWTPCIAPSGLTIYTGDRFPQWRGDLLAGGLVLEQIRRVDLDPDGAILGQETLDIGRRVRDVRTGPDGFIYVLTDEDKGVLLRLEPTDAAP